MEGAEAISWAAIIVAVAALLSALGVLALMIRSGRSSADASVGSSRIAEIERRVLQSARRIESLENELDAVPGRVHELEPGVETAPRREGTISRIGLVRFDAFDDTGGGRSFALVLLDAEGHGVVLTSLHSRQTTRLYVKDIRAGVADAPLSSEEERALRKAGLDP